MKPSQLAIHLRRMASAIDTSKTPSRALVARDLRRVLATMDLQPTTKEWAHSLQKAASSAGFPGEVSAIGADSWWVKFPDVGVAFMVVGPESAHLHGDGLADTGLDIYWINGGKTKFVDNMSVGRISARDIADAVKFLQDHKADKELESSLGIS